MRTIATLVLALAAIGCRSKWVLSRESTVVSGLIHIASFDATERGNYNYMNCMHAKGLFESQPGVKVRYHCQED